MELFFDRGAGTVRPLELRIPATRINEIIRGKRGISAETAWALLRHERAPLDRHAS